MALLAGNVTAAELFIPMGKKGQANHLRAYGIVYSALQAHIRVDWLLNYEGGSFAMPYTDSMAALCDQRGVSWNIMTGADYRDLKKEVKGLKYNGNVVALKRAPRIAVYTPLNKEPWDDAVTLALTYAQIPFDKLYVDEVMAGKLDNYDWLHLHHEDFTGQYGKFWLQYRDAQWYKDDVRTTEELAAKYGYKKVQLMQLAVVKRIRSFVKNGGNLFAMCSATDTYDIALAADTVDICAAQFDGDPPDPAAQQKLNFNKCFAFTGFTLFTDPQFYEFSSIDNTNFRHVARDSDYFRLEDFSASDEVIPTMLCQNHERTIKGFMGQTTAFRMEAIKDDVTIMATCDAAHEARYIHGEHGKGSWTFYGGHDPEDYAHPVGAPPTDLDLHRNSPGYRLILNNVLLPAAVAQASDDTLEVIAREQVLVNPPAPATSKVSITTDPLKNELTLHCHEPENCIIKNVQLRNGKGKTELDKNFNSAEVHISLNGLPAGVYEIVVNGKNAGKVVKE